MKNTKLVRWENATFALGFQFFNRLNYSNFGFPVSALKTSAVPTTYLEQLPTNILGGGSESLELMWPPE